MNFNVIFRTLFLIQQYINILPDEEYISRIDDFTSK